MDENRDKTPQEKKPKNPLLIAMVVLLGLFIAAIIVIAVTFFISNMGKPKTDNHDDLNTYLTIFSLFMTLVTLIVPLTSYILNREQTKRLKDEFDERVEDTTKKYEEKNKELQKSIDRFDSRYLALAESIVNKYSVAKDERDSLYTSTNIDYINAELAYNRGEYAGCEKNIESAAADIIRHFEKLAKNESIEIDDDKFALLTYKVFNLYRHLAGRTRSFEAVLGSLNIVNDIAQKSLEVRLSKAYVVVVYTFIRTKLDSIEKANNTKSISSLEQTKKFVDEVTGMIDKINGSQWSCLRLSQKVRLYQIAARYSTSKKEKGEEKSKKEEYNEEAFESAEEYCANAENYDLTDGHEVDKALRIGSCFSMAKSLEKLSYDFPKDESAVSVCAEDIPRVSKLAATRESLLNNAHALIRVLIENKRDDKYYLELSEILKKLKRTDESDCAAQYGYALAPSDPMLAAQCAYVYIREFLASGKNNIAYLNKAEECSENAHWIYNMEKNRYGEKRVNVKFLYIASMNALIKTFVYVSPPTSEFKGKSEKEVTDALKYILSNEKRQGIANRTLADDVADSVGSNCNSVPNYTRAMICYLECMNYVKKLCDDGYIASETKDKTIADYLFAIYDICCKYLMNEALWFDEGSTFYETTGDIIKLLCTMVGKKIGCRYEEYSKDRLYKGHIHMDAKQIDPRDFVINYSRPHITEIPLSETEEVMKQLKKMLDASNNYIERI